MSRPKIVAAGTIVSNQNDWTPKRGYTVRLGVLELGHLVVSISYDTLGELPASPIARINMSRKEEPFLSFMSDGKFGLSLEPVGNFSCDLARKIEDNIATIIEKCAGGTRRYLVGLAIAGEG